MRHAGASQGRWLRLLMRVTDLGFLAYWAITLLHWIPPEWLFKDYENPLLRSWNGSFLPVDLLVSWTGLRVLRLGATPPERAHALTLISLTLTSLSGLMAIALGSMRCDFCLLWWAPNLVLLLWPLPFLARSLQGHVLIAPAGVPRP